MTTCNAECYVCGRFDCNRFVGDKNFCCKTCMNAYVKSPEKYMPKEKRRKTKMSEKREVKCPYCSSLLYCEKILNPGAPIFENPVYKIPSPEKQKHEEIKSLAEKIYAIDIPKLAVMDYNTYFKRAWERAEEFYNLAKQKKEDEGNN